MRVISTLIFVIALLFSAQHARAELPIELQLLPPGHTLVVLEERRIYFQPQGGGPVYYIPIAIGKPGMDRGILGSWTITRKEEWPTWTPTKAMLARDCKKYCKWRTGKPGGPNNPLGARALYLGTSTYRLHGTNEPDSIGKAVSQGCIRMRNEDVVWLAERVHVGTSVVVVQRLEDYLGEIPAGGTSADAKEEFGDPEPHEGVEEFDDTPVNSAFVHPFYD